MAMPASQTVPNSPNPSAQSSSCDRDWSSLRTGEPGLAFRGITRGRGSRGGGARGGRGGGHLPANSGQKGGSRPVAADSTPSLSPKVHKPPVPAIPTPDGVPAKPANGSAERGGRSKPVSRKQPRVVPAVVVAPASPSEAPQTTPPTPSRSAHRRRRPQAGKGTTATTKPSPPSVIKSQKPRGGSTPASQIVVRKDVPPHLAAAHEAEIRHDIDALVERVRAVAMAENRPTTPGSHIDWAGDEDDTLPDLDDWGVTTSNTACNDNQSEISPILADTLKPLPEPNSEIHQEEEQEMETYDSQSERSEHSSPQPSFMPSSIQKVTVSSTKAASEQCIMVPASVKESSPARSDGKLSLHPSHPTKPIATTESLCVQGSSISKPSGFPPIFIEEETLTAKTEGLSESIHAPPANERFTLTESVSSTSSSERGLTTSIHAPIPGLPESHSAPNLLFAHPTSTVPRTHSRSQTEGRSGLHQSHATPPGTVPHRRGRSGASSPLGKHVYTHARNHSTPAGNAGLRPPQTARPVITGDAISRLARTIGGLGPTSRTQAIPATNDSTVSSGLRLTS